MSVAELMACVATHGCESAHQVRETSRKPDELYSLLERLSPGTRKLEIFARQHNCQPGWVGLGNQLDGTRILDPDMKACPLRRSRFTLQSQSTVVFLLSACCLRKNGDVAFPAVGLIKGMHPAVEGRMCRRAMT